MKFTNDGSVVMFSPEGDYEYEWLMLNTDSEPYQWLGRNLVIDHRMAEDLIEGVISAGFVCTSECKHINQYVGDRNTFICSDCDIDLGR